MASLVEGFLGRDGFLGREGFLGLLGLARVVIEVVPIGKPPDCRSGKTRDVEVVGVGASDGSIMGQIPRLSAISRSYQGGAGLGGGTGLKVFKKTGTGNSAAKL